MVEQLQSVDNSWLVIPFYIDPKLSTYEETVGRFGNFLACSKQVTGLNLAVIDDGAKLTPEIVKTADFIVKLPKNRGKASALREGLRNLLSEPNVDAGFIVQYDGDGDQSYVDIPTVHNRLIEVAEGNPDIPTLIIGDRYAEGLLTPPNPESVTYRQSILMYFGAIAKELGFPDVRDWVSGARGYTRAYAREFLNSSRSERYGLESEQLVVASLSGSRVCTVPLTQSRPRDPHTLTSKWLQNFEVYLEHDAPLRERGKGYVVDLIGDMVGRLKEQQDQFDLDLTPLGEDTMLHFTRLGDTYTAEIPAEYRAKLFAENEFPFTIRK